ncbi:MAG TPA: ABC transporter substrate-binding protein [Methylophilaceae bacterium]|jgi:phospholipid transport system substrate-binding protein
MNIFKVLLVLLAIVTTGALTGMTSDETVPPDQMVKTVSSEVLEIVKNDKDIQSGDTKKVTALAQEKVLPHFDFERMSRNALGKPWATATPEQQQAFVQEFRQLTTRTYSSALTKYRNQTIKYMPYTPQPNATEAKVKTLILQPGGQSIPVEYLLEKESDQWKVFDVVIDGLSLTAAHRGEYAAEVQQNGMDGLIKKLAAMNNK